MAKHRGTGRGVSLRVRAQPDLSVAAAGSQCGL